MKPKPAKPPTTVLKLRLIDKDGKPMVVPEGVLSWGGDLLQCKTNADGVLIPFDADESADPAVPFVVNGSVSHGELDIKIGFPAGEIFRSTLMTLTIVVTDFGGADTPQGAAARMNNLGYLALTAGDAGALPSTLAPSALAALKRFRMANSLATPSGAADAIEAATRDRLFDAHDNVKGPLIK